MVLVAIDKAVFLYRRKSSCIRTYTHPYERTHAHPTPGIRGCCLGEEEDRVVVELFWVSCAPVSAYHACGGSRLHGGDKRLTPIGIMRRAPSCRPGVARNTPWSEGSRTMRVQNNPCFSFPSDSLVLRSVHASPLHRSAPSKGAPFFTESL